MVRLIKSQLPWFFSRIKFSSHNRIVTNKSLSETLILASTNPQNDKRLFIELRVQYKKTTSSIHVVYTNCSECPNCGLVDARISAFDKNLPVSLQVHKSAKNLDL